MDYSNVISSSEIAPTLSDDQTFGALMHGRVHTSGRAVAEATVCSSPILMGWWSEQYKKLVMHIEVRLKL
jgi:hypothetical protein